MNSLPLSVDPTRGVKVHWQGFFDFISEGEEN
jgi:hypothetical protein